MPKSQKYKSKPMKINKKSKKSKKTRKSKRKLNPFMKELQKARKNDLDDFEYKGKTYVKKIAKTGMVIYKGKK